MKGLPYQSTNSKLNTKNSKLCPLPSTLCPRVTSDESRNRRHRPNAQAGASAEVPTGRGPPSSATTSRSLTIVNLQSQIVNWHASSPLYCLYYYGIQDIFYPPHRVGFSAQNPPSSIEHPESSIKHPVSSIHHRVSSIQHLPLVLGHGSCVFCLPYTLYALRSPLSFPRDHLRKRL